jgi:hypothetical protein
MNGFGETLNGIRAQTPNHQFLVPVDPYVKPGDASSGFCHSSWTAARHAGRGDASIQLTTSASASRRSPTNQLPIEPPPGYDREEIRAARPLFRSARRREQEGDAEEVHEDRHGHAGQDGH